MHVTTYDVLAVCYRIHTSAVDAVYHRRHTHSLDHKVESLAPSVTIMADLHQVHVALILHIRYIGSTWYEYSYAYEVLTCVNGTTKRHNGARRIRILFVYSIAGRYK